jgi:hypothetical protein
MRYIDDYISCSEQLRVEAPHCIVPSFFNHHNGNLWMALLFSTPCDPTIIYYHEHLSSSFSGGTLSCSYDFGKLSLLGHQSALLIVIG